MRFRWGVLALYIATILVLSVISIYGPTMLQTGLRFIQ